MKNHDSKINSLLKVYSSQENCNIDDFVDLKSHDPLVVSGLGYRVHQSDLDTVTAGAKLNDKIINFYLSLLSNSITHLKAATIDSIFINKIFSGDQRGISKCLEKYNKSKFQLIIFPLFIKGNHWAILIIDIIKTKIYFYDSIFKIDSNFITKVTTTLSKYITSLNTCSTWPIYSDFMYPKQINNESDCGVFICQYAKYHLSNRLLDFSQSDIVNKRIEMANEIRKFEIISIQHD